MVFIRLNVFFRFVKEFVNAFRLLSGLSARLLALESDLGSALVLLFCHLLPGFESLLYESSYEVPQWLSVFLFAIVQI
jgi:hypothetical protein